MAEKQNKSWDESEKEIILYETEEESAKQLVKYLEYAGLSPFLQNKDTENLTQIIIHEQEAYQARQLVDFFLKEEAKKIQQEDNNRTESNPAFRTEDSMYSAGSAAPHSYRTNEDKYEDNSSSAFSFFAVGTVLLIFLILAHINIVNLPITFEQNPLMAIVLSVTGVVFEIIGYISFRSANRFKSRIAAEKQLKNEIIDWFSASCTKESIDKLTLREFASDEFQNIPEELLCQKKIETIYCLIDREYPGTDKSFSEALSEELYQQLYESN